MSHSIYSPIGKLWCYEYNISTNTLIEVNEFKQQPSELRQEYLYDLYDYVLRYDYLSIYGYPKSFLKIYLNLTDIQTIEFKLDPKYMVDISKKINEIPCIKELITIIKDQLKQNLINVILAPKGKYIHNMILSF